MGAEDWGGVVSGLGERPMLFAGTLLFLLGWLNFVVMVIPVLVAAAAMGVWLFYVQHQFENTSWDTGETWDRKRGALTGSSYYVLPSVLGWFTGNIGLHHIHHLCSHIPNYRLQECLDAMPELKTINRLTIVESLKTASLALWDPKARKLVSFQGI